MSAELLIGSGEVEQTAQVDAVGAARIGSTVFEALAVDAAIYTNSEAKDDWRIHQLTDRVAFKRESIQDGVHELCRQYLSYYGLSYGAFDFIESKDGEITFLECNTNGQFRWLEETLDMPITDAIVDTLIKNT
jgi:glutathione synthase/RimK-type ligase-like ATP-grasp enzyme